MNAAISAPFVPMASPLPALRALALRGLSLEYAVLAPYLTALWSLHEDTNVEARTLLRSVAMEEMLHMCVASNLLLALGGEPSLPRIDLPVGPLTRERLAWFCALEAPDGAPEAEVARGERTEDVYRPLRAALLDAVEMLGEDRVFCGDPARQLPASMYYGGRGVLRPVTDLASALVALDLLLDQTCGRDGVDPGASDEPAADSHYRRFRALLAGRSFAPGDRFEPTGAPVGVAWDKVWAFDGQWSSDPGIRGAQDTFRREWYALADGLVLVLRGDHARFPMMARRMCTLGPEAVRLMRLPGNSPGIGAGPVF